MSPEHHDRLSEALDEVEDVTAFDAAMAEEGPDVSWDQVKDLGGE